jgi:hypothetical protein
MGMSNTPRLQTIGTPQRFTFGTFRTFEIGNFIVTASHSTFAGKRFWHVVNKDRRVDNAGPGQTVKQIRASLAFLLREA